VPIFIHPAPVVVHPVPVYRPITVVQPVVQPVYQPVYQAQPPDPPLAVGSWRADLDRSYSLLSDADERMRAEGAIQLGRSRAHEAVDRLTIMLASDRSPVAREAAARALGLIGSPRAIPALQQAAQADTDRDVRHSAQFAVEVIQTSRR
jgi:hypothetical protein